MKTKMVSFLVAVLALVALTVIATSTASAFAEIQQVVVNGLELEAGDGTTVSVFAGETISVRVRFSASATEEEARVTARILGEPGTYVDTEEFAVIANGSYSRLLNVELPSDLDEDLDEPLTLEVVVEGKNQGTGDEEQIQLRIQRSNDLIEILAAEFSSDSVRAGENLAVDVVVDNKGRHLSEETFVRVSIPALGLSKMVFLDDLSAVDQEDPDRDESAVGRVFLAIPRDAPAGVYDVRIEVFSEESSTSMDRRVVIVSAGSDSRVVSSGMSKTFAVGQEQVYTLTLVNTGSTIAVYDLVVEADSGLTINLDESVVAVPAGTSKTVTLRAVASEKGSYNFAVNVHSDGELVKTQSYTANVEGRTAAGGNAAVVLTIILAIIFVVLLVVLIVLLTRKPQKSEEFGESYY